jgi:hypothetical protein
LETSLAKQPKQSNKITRKEVTRYFCNSGEQEHKEEKKKTLQTLNGHYRQKPARGLSCWLHDLFVLLLLTLAALAREQNRDHAFG